MKRKRGLAASQKYNFSGGVVTTVAKTRLRPSQLIKGKNIDVAINGEASVRGGYTRVSAVAFGTEIDRFIHFKTDTYDKIIAYGGAYVKRLDTGTPDVWTTLSSTMPDTEDFRSMEIANGMLYIAAHNGVKKYYPAQSALWNAGIVAPTTKLTVADASVAGNLLGTFQWYYTYYNSVTGEESNPNAISDELTLTNSQATLSGFVASTDPQVNKQRIYRNPTGTTSYQFVAEKDNDTDDYTDNVADDNLGLEMSERNAIPPNATILLWHMNRMFYVDYSNKSKLCWSEPFLPGSVYDDQYQVIEAGDGGQIIALVPSYGNIIVFKNTGVFTFFWNPTDPLNSTYEPLASKYPVLAAQSAKNVREDVVFLSAEGLKRISQAGTKIEDIQVLVEGEFGAVPIDPVANIFRECHMDVISKAVGIFYEAKNQFHISVPYYTNGNNDLTLVWNMDANVFTLHEGFNVKAAAPYRQYDNELLYRSHNDQYIYRHDYGFTDNGAAIAYEVQAAWNQVDGLPDYKRIRLFLPTVKGASGVTFNYEILKDFQAAGGGRGGAINHIGASYWGQAHWGQDYWGQTGEVPYRLKLRLIGRTFSVRFFGTTTLPLGIIEYQFFYQPKAL